MARRLLLADVEPLCDLAAGIDVDPGLTDDLLSSFTPDGRLARDPARWGPWVLFAVGSHTRAVIEAALVELGAPLDIVAESNQPEVLRTMVSLGVGATALPVVQAGELGPGEVIAERRLVIATRRGAAGDPAVEMLTAALRGSP